MHYFKKGPENVVSFKTIILESLITIQLLEIQGFFRCDPLQPFFRYALVLGTFFISFQLIKRLIPLHGPLSCPAILLLREASCRTRLLQIYPNFQPALHAYYAEPAATLELSA